MKGEGGNADNIDGRLGRFFEGKGAFFAGFFDVEADDLVQGAIGGLQFIHAVVIHIGQEHITLGIQLSTFHEVL